MGIVQIASTEAPLLYVARHRAGSTKHLHLHRKGPTRQACERSGTHPQYLRGTNQDMIPAALDVVRFVALLGGGLLLPGWLLGRVLGTRVGMVGAAIGSAAVLPNLLLCLSILGVRIDLAHAGTAIALLCIALAVIAKFRLRDAASSTQLELPHRWGSVAFAIPVLLGMSAIVALAVLTPLSGWDVGFRWNYLATEIVRTGTMKFYPPITADDFLHYCWCDGISPLVSSLYVWSYFSLGRIEDWATAPVVVAQGAAIFYLVWKLATERGGAMSGAIASALLACSAMFLWSVGMGQETGITALSLLAMFWFIEISRKRAEIGWIVWAGLAAGLGALAREYGLCFPVLGWLALTWSTQTYRHRFAFLGAAAVVALPWYLFVWIKTGHPLYCVDLGSAFPVNPVHREYMRLTAHDFSPLSNPSVYATVPGQLAMLAGVPLILGLIGGLARWDEAKPWLLAMGVLFLVWFWAAVFTAGGVLYSMRVLSPVIALGAVLGGIWLGPMLGICRAWGLGVVLSAFAIHASQTALTLPVDPYPKWWTAPFLDWTITDALGKQWRSHPRWAAITSAAEGRKILVSDPTMYTVLKEHGGRSVPIFSPEVRFLFQPRTNFVADVARLREEGYRFIVLSSVEGSLVERLFKEHPFFPALAHSIKPVSVTRFYSLYDLYPPEQQSTDPGHR